MNKKGRKLIIATIVVVALATTLFVGCKKDKEVVVNSNRNEVKALMNRIEAFQTLRDAVNSGTKAEGSMTLTEMRETFSLVANYEYSEHEIYCLNTTLDTLKVAMPTIDCQGNVSNVDAVVAYNAFVDALQKHMKSIHDERDVPSLFSIVLPQTEVKDNDSINFVFTRGQQIEQEPTSPMVSGPFEDVCYFWGGRRGRCDGGTNPNYPTDATYELSRYFQFDYSPYINGTFIFLNIEHVCFVATDQFNNPNWTYWEPSTHPVQCGAWLFYEYGLLDPEENPCLCEDMLNCEYIAIKNNITLQSGAKYYSPNNQLPYFKCDVIADSIPLLTSKSSSYFLGRVHLANVTYATYYFAPNQY